MPHITTIRKTAVPERLPVEEFVIRLTRDEGKQILESYSSWHVFSHGIWDIMRPIHETLSRELKDG